MHLPLFMLLIVAHLGVKAVLSAMTAALAIGFFWEATNIGAALVTRSAGIDVTVTAGGLSRLSGNVGNIIDRSLIGMPLSCVLGILYDATLAAGQTMTVAWSLAHASDPLMATGTVFANGSVVIPALATPGEALDVIEEDLDLSGALEYLQLTVTPTLSALETDTATLSASITFGGSDEIAQPQG